MKHKPEKIVWKTKFHELDLLQRFSFQGDPFLKVSKTEAENRRTRQHTAFRGTEIVQIRVPQPKIKPITLH